MRIFIAATSPSLSAELCPTCVAATLFVAAGEPNNFFFLNQQCVAAYTWVKRYNYFTGSDTNVDANYVALGGNGLDNLLGWADEECSREYAYICEFTGRMSGAARPCFASCNRLNAHDASGSQIHQPDGCHLGPALARLRLTKPLPPLQCRVRGRLRLHDGRIWE